MNVFYVKSYFTELIDQNLRLAHGQGASPVAAAPGRQDVAAAEKVYKQLNNL